MKITIKNYIDLGPRAEKIGFNLISSSSWDAARVIEGGFSDSFFIPKERNAWIQKCNKELVTIKRAESVGDFLNVQKYKGVYSLGAGSACLEYHLKVKCPKIFLGCSDYAPASIAVLQDNFKEADIIERFDMVYDTWVNLGEETLYLFFRIDTDFTDSQLRSIFSNMARAGIEHILFVPAEILTLNSLSRKVRYAFYRMLKKRLQGSKFTFSGYLRTKDRFVSLFENYYDYEEIKIYDIVGFYLKKK